MCSKHINDIFAALTPCEEQEDRLLQRIWQKSKDMSQENRGSFSISRLRPALTAALITICLITTTVFAASSMGLDIGFFNFLKPADEKQAEYLANGAYVMDKQVTNKSGTLDIKQVIGDGNLTYILMDFIAAEETPLTMSRYRFANNDFNAGQNFYSVDFISLTDENTADNKISMIMRVMTKKSLAGQKVNLKLTDLQGAESSTGAFDTIIPGEWKTSFLLDFQEYSSDYPVNQEITMFDYAATVKNISISPISIAIKIESPFLEKISEASKQDLKIEEKEHLDNYPITINYKDGTSETTTTFSGMYLAEYGLDEMLNIKTFENVINDKEIESILFFGTKINIAQYAQ